MNNPIPQLIELVRDNPELWLWLGLFSLLSFIITLTFIPWLILQLPPDYFEHDKAPAMSWAKAHPLLRLILLIAKNLLGIFFFTMGVLLLVLPGQGLLTMAFGILLLDFPGKYKLKSWLFRRRSIRRSVNWLRLRYSREPFRFPQQRRRNVNSP